MSNQTPEKRVCGGRNLVFAWFLPFLSHTHNITFVLKVVYSNLFFCQMVMAVIEWKKLILIWMLLYSKHTMGAYIDNNFISIFYPLLVWRAKKLCTYYKRFNILFLVYCLFFIHLSSIYSYYRSSVIVFWIQYFLWV